jgi:hypothetical protein
MLQLPTVRTTYESSVDLIMLLSFLLIVVAQVLVFGQVETDVPRFPTPGTTWPSKIAAITRNIGGSRNTKIKTTGRELLAFV